MGLTNSEIKKIVNRYIGVSNGYLGNFSYRTHTDFYPEYCDLDIDPNQYEGTTRQRFTTILENSAPDVQAKIVRGVLEKFSVEAKDKPETRTKQLYDDLLEVVRRLEDNQVDDESMIAKPNKQISILLLSADPSDASRLRIGEEFRNIQEKLQLAKFRDFFKIDHRMSVRPADISQALLDLRPHIVHFSGHGTHDGNLCFENHLGKIQSVSSEALTALFEQFSAHIECVLLNACYSEAQAFAIAEHISYVIGMNQAIGDSAAIAFAIGFYQAMGSGCSVEEAYKLGCVQVQLQGIPEHLTPVIVQKNKKIKLSPISQEIKITVLVVTTGSRFTGNVPYDMLVSQLKVSVIEHLSLPTEFSNGWPVGYSLMNRTQNKVLQDNLTVRENEVQSGDELVFIVEAMAG